jgi:class 3 adenylate cyclase/tetratricopeptide (TPR) repeat protein
MDFYEVLARVIDVLQREGRTSYRALKRQFDVDDAFLEDLKVELIEVKRLAVDQDGTMLIWTGETKSEVAAADRSTQAEPSPSELPRPDAERRQLTVMFCDLVDSTLLSAQLDPEDLREVVQAYQQTCAAVVQRFAGHIAQLLGDGLLVYFGWPQAHEDDAQRAVRAGLGMLAAMGTLNTRLEQERGIRLAIRVGIHTGLVVIGKMGSSGHQEQLALGETPNLASRIQWIADPNTVAISDVTFRLIEGYFTCQALGEQRFRGVSQPMSVYRVHGESGVQSRLDIVPPHGLTPLVGREHEIGLLLERWEQVKEGQGHVIILSGEAGIGKSRLVQVMKNHIAQRAVCLECRCSPYHQHTAFYPLTDLLRQFLQWQDDESLAVKQQKLEIFVAQHQLPRADSVPLLATLLSLSLPDMHYPPLRLSSQQQRQKTLEILLALLVEQARLQPIVFIVEDLHWIDPSTLEFLGLLISQGPMLAVLTVLTCRPAFEPPWRLRTHITPVTLSRLSRTQMESMITSIAGGKTLPAAVIAQLVAKTDGIPLFIEELTKAVLESDWLDEGTHRYELRGPLPSLTIPATLQDSLVARLDRLGQGKEVAQLAAAIGRQFSYALLRSVAPWDDVTFQQGLRQLIEAELCYQHGVPPQATYLFKHALIRDAAYDSLLRSRRRQIHGQIARVLEGEVGGFKEREPETIARHYEAAQEIERAIGHWESAGQQARQHSANQEAAAHFAHAIDLLSSLEEQTERAELELRLRLELGGQLIACHGNGAAVVEENYARAQALLESVRDRRLTFRARHGLRTFYIVRGPLQKARELGEQLLELANELGDDSLLLQAHRPHGLCLFAMGELAPARQHLERAIALYRADVHSVQRFEYISDPLVLARCNLGWAACFLSERENALEQTERAIVFAEQLDHKHSLAFALSLAASTRQALRELEATQALAERTLFLSKTCGYPYWVAWAQMLLGWVRGRSGERRHAAEEVQEGLRSYRGTGARMMLPYFLVLLAEVEMQRSEPEAALLHLEEAKGMIDITGTRFYEAEIYRLMGCLLVNHFDKPREAGQTFLKAIDIAARQGNTLLQNYAQQSLAEFLGAQQASNAWA